MKDVCEIFEREFGVTFDDPDTTPELTADDGEVIYFYVL